MQHLDMTQPRQIAYSSEARFGHGPENKESKKVVEYISNNQLERSSDRLPGSWRVRSDSPRAQSELRASIPEGTRIHSDTQVVNGWASAAVRVYCGRLSRMMHVAD